MMYGRKKPAFPMQHPVITTMVIGFAVIGACGVFAALRQKADKLRQAAKKMGCDCIQQVGKATEDMLEDGMDAACDMMEKVKKKNQ